MNHVAMKQEPLNNSPKTIQQASEPMANQTAASNDTLLGALGSLRSFRKEAEIHAIRRALQYTGWNRKRAAQLLRISYRGLLYKIREHNITPAVAGQVISIAESAKVR